mmetsp:Transcript_24369/g.37776  ORF Transcript_24369/g.37776 Transcript_24369/m.37776 type:complete len:281 (+) Transcript_24369:205-1047(+)
MNSSSRASFHRGVIFAILCIAALSTIAQLNHFSADAFVPQTIITRKQTMLSPTTILPINHHHTQSRNRYIITTPNMATTTSSDEDLHNEINSMKAKDIRQELQSYGIPTKAFFEKSELVDALVTARKEGKTPVVGVNGDDDGATSSASTSDASSSSSSETTTSASSNNNNKSSSANRQERLKQEMEKCKSMKVGELKKELESYGVSTKSFFEKSEFVRAVAEIRVDGVKKKQTSTSTAGSTSGTVKEEEARDPSFRDVTVSKFTGDKALLGRGVIDVKAR